MQYHRRKEKLQRKMKKVTERNSSSLINNLKFNWIDYFNKPLAFSLKKKTNKDQVIEKLLNLPRGNDKYYTGHTKGPNMFMIKQDPKQEEEGWLCRTILNSDKKLHCQN